MFQVYFKTVSRMSQEFWRLFLVYFMNISDMFHSCFKNVVTTPTQPQHHLGYVQQLAIILLVSCVKIISKYHLFQPIRCLFRPLKMPKYDNLRPLITPKRLHLISGAWKSQKGAISGPWKCQKSFISGPWKLQKGFSWFQGPEKAKKVSFQAPETAKMCERFFMTNLALIEEKNGEKYELEVELTRRNRRLNSMRSRRRCESSLTRGIG